MSFTLKPFQGAHRSAQCKSMHFYFLPVVKCDLTCDLSVLTPHNTPSLYGRAHSHKPRIPLRWVHSPRMSTTLEHVKYFPWKDLPLPFPAVGKQCPVQRWRPCEYTDGSASFQSCPQLQPASWWLHLWSWDSGGR